MQGEHDRVLLAHGEGREGPLEEQDQRDGDQRAKRDLSAMHRTCRHNERDRREDVHDPSPSRRSTRSRLCTRHVAFVDPVDDERDGEGDRHASDEPRIAHRDRASAASHRFESFSGFALVGLELSSEKSVSMSERCCRGARREGP